MELDGETHLSSKKIHVDQRRFLLTGKKANTTPFFETGKEEEEKYSILTVKLMKSRLDKWEIFNPDSSPVFSVEKGCWETGEEQGDYHWPET